MLDQLQPSGFPLKGHDCLTPFKTPTVSVVVTNYNYGRFLKDAVQSVARQTYAHIECVVIDDKSSDDSVAILEDLKAAHPWLTYHVNDENSGQSASMLAGLARTTGDYVVFLDSDDYLLPACIETHIQAHLSLRAPVGFTSVDTVTVRNGQFVTAANPHFSSFFVANAQTTQSLFRPLDTSTFVFSPSALDASELQGVLCYVEPTQSDDWPWSPTSGNCFRRDALMLVMSNEKLASLRSCTDCYVLRGVACLTGSVLIDRPLMAYRVHGKNDFATGAKLNRLRSFELSYLETRSGQAMMMLIDHLLDRAKIFRRSFEQDRFFEEAVDTLDRVYPPICASGPSYVTRRLILDRDRLRAELGPDAYDAWLLAKATPRYKDRIMRSGFARSLFNRYGLPRLVEQAKAPVAAPNAPAV